MATKKYDLIVLGSGPAGEKGAAQAAYFGKRVAMVERSPNLGGASTNTGTLSSKTLRETALALSQFRSRMLYGLDLALKHDATVQDFLYHERHVTAAERERVEANLRNHRIDLYRGIGMFDSPRAVRVLGEGGATEMLEADFVLVATGSSPVRPPLFPYNDERVWDSDEIVNMEFMPKRLAVVGGGVIGCEYACTFAALGVEVCLLDGRTELLDFLDRDIWQVLRKSMSEIGVQFMLGEKVASASCDRDPIVITVESGRTIEVDAVLVAAGRQANTADLNLAAAGLEADARGRLAVDAHFQTSVAGIYAAGDVIGFPALASTSMEQARLAMVHAFDLKYKKTAVPVLPMGVYTIPEVSVAGETEATLLEKHIPFVVGRAYYRDNARGKIIGDRSGVLKLIFGADDMRLLGVSVVGENATELIHIGLVGLLMEAGQELFIEACFNYPTLGQLYKYATYDAMDQRQAMAQMA
jgi:NAD(P) transhydrogenase